MKYVKYVIMKYVKERKYKDESKNKLPQALDTTAAALTKTPNNAW